MKLDLHLHTRASFDCESEPSEIIKWAVNKGIDALAVTEHDSTDGYHDLNEAATGQPIFIIPGVEKTCARGTHYLVYFTPQLPLPDDDLDMIREVHQRGGLVSLPHPYRSDTGLKYNQIIKGLYGANEVEAILKELDLLEVFNAKSTFVQNRKAGLLANEHPYLKMTAGSDSHHPSTVGAAHVEFRDLQHVSLSTIAKQLRTVQGRIITLPELDRSSIGRSVSGSVEGMRRLAVKIKPLVPESIWRTGKQLYRQVSNRAATNRALKSIKQ